MLKETIYVNSRFGWLTVVLAFLVLVEGCAQPDTTPDSVFGARLISSSEVVRVSTTGQADPILMFVADSPIAGRAGRVTDWGGTTAVFVRVDRAYESASGHSCRSYHVSVSEAAPTGRSGLACQSTDGEWLQSELFVNPFSLAGSGRSGSREVER